MNNTPGNIRVTLHADGSGSPAATALATLSGSNPTTNNTDYTFTCSDCYLTPNTKYWLVLAAPSSTGDFSSYTWNLTGSNAQTPGPSGSGWTIGDVVKYQVTSGSNSSCPSGWCDNSGSRTAMFLVSATVSAVAPPQSFTVDRFSYDPNDYRNVIHHLSWNKPANSGTASFAYELQCTSVKQPTSTTSWNVCDTKTVAATSNSTLTLDITQIGTSGNLFQNIRIRAKSGSEYSRWIVAPTHYNSP